MGGKTLSSELQDEIINTIEQVTCRKELAEESLELRSILRETLKFFDEDELPNIRTLSNILSGSGASFDCLSEDLQEQVKDTREFIGQKKPRRILSDDVKSEVIDAFEQITCQKELKDKFLSIREISMETHDLLDDEKYPAGRTIHHIFLRDGNSYNLMDWQLKMRVDYIRDFIDPKPLISHPDEVKTKIIKTFERIAKQKALNGEELEISPIARETHNCLKEFLGDALPPIKTIRCFFAESHDSYKALRPELKECVDNLRELIDPKPCFNLHIQPEDRQDIINTFEQIVGRRYLEGESLKLRPIAIETAKDFPDVSLSVIQHMFSKSYTPLSRKEKRKITSIRRFANLGRKKKKRERIQLANDEIINILTKIKNKLEKMPKTAAIEETCEDERVCGKITRMFSTNQGPYKKIKNQKIKELVDEINALNEKYKGLRILGLNVNSVKKPGA